MGVKFTNRCHPPELGLRTDDKNIIENLISRFEDASSLDNSDKTFINKL